MIYIRSKRPIAERNGIAKQKGMITVAAEEKDKQEKELEEQIQSMYVKDKMGRASCRERV